MTTFNLQSELARIGRRIGIHEAARVASTGTAVFLGAWTLAGLLDVAFHLHAGIRWITACALVVTLAVTLIAVVRRCAAKHTAESVAARIERVFPHLDNHLINHVQFAGRGAATLLERAYLHDPVPGWDRVDVRQLHDRPALRRALIASSAVAMCFVAPLFWSSAIWINALSRVFNPFSQRAPSTLASISVIEPGNVTVLKGNTIAFSCQATGIEGHKAWLDLWPADDETASIPLGRIMGTGTNSFHHALPSIAANLQYQFRVGDARSDTFRVTVTPPLALSRFDLRVEPPAYTRLTAQTFDALHDTFSIPFGSDAIVTIESSRPLQHAEAVNRVRLAPSHDHLAFSGRHTVTSGGPLTINARATDGESLLVDAHYRLTPDQPPQIRILAPTTRATLATGERPFIRFEIVDDYGLSEIRIESVATTADGNGPAAGTIFQQWKIEGDRAIARSWSGPSLAGDVVTYRVVARDTREIPGATPPLGPQETVSAPVTFEPVTPRDAVAQREKLSHDTMATLGQLVELQKTNLARTTALATDISNATPTQWTELAATQQQIRDLAGILVAHPSKPLGWLASNVRELHEGLMREAVTALAQIPATDDPAARRPLADNAVALETKILRALTFTAVAAPETLQQAQVTGVLALLDALVKGQTDTLAATRMSVSENSAPPRSLVDKQDRLASSTTEFAAICRTESANLETSDPAFAKLIAQVAAECDKRQVAADMLRAAEQLESKSPAAAVPFQERALAALKEFQASLNTWRVEQAGRDWDDLKILAAESKEKFEKLAALQEKLIESIRALEQQKDMSDADRDALKKEIAALKQNIKDATLQIANDLHIFPNLPVGNELVQDIFETFEEMAQVPGSASSPPTEIGLQKEDEILELLKGAAERMDDMEMWLAAKPDNVKRLTENFDQEEMPEVGLTPMPTELEDIVGDLLEQQDDIREQSDDSSTNQGVADLPAGWDIMEGEWTSFAAKGKSGNERPEHAEQTGRSLVGREGMADGETVAGSGQIRAGDEDIKKRRTNDPSQAGEVKEETNTDAVATGGGKLSGTASEQGMTGQGPRRDSNAPGDLRGWQAMLRRDTEALYAQATLLRIRTGSLDEAIQFMRQAEDALARGQPIQQVREYQRRAAEALKRTQLELGAGAVIDTGPVEPAPAPVDNNVAGTPDEAPTGYRDLVSDYYKSLSGAAP